MSLTLLKNRGAQIIKSVLLIFSPLKQIRTRSTFKWGACTTRRGKCLVQRLTFLKLSPYKKISKTPARNAQLQNSRLIHQWRLQQYHSIPFWGLVNIYKVLIAPNGHKFTICQVIISKKSIQDHISPLFTGVDQSLKGVVVIICDISIKEEAEALLSHFGIYLAVVFNSVIWEDFTVAYRTSMEEFQ